MPRFKYSALSNVGAVITGELEAPDATAVIEHLHGKALLPIVASEFQPRSTFVGFRRGRPRTLPLGELALFTQQLARLLKAGLPLDRALGILLDLSASRQVQKVLRHTLDGVRNGASLAEAMAMSGKAFPSAYVSMIRAGEVGGALADVLVRVADFLAASEAMRQKIVSALIYPAILIVVAGLSLSVALGFVLPQFETVFRDAGAQLPLLTQVMMTASDILQSYWWGFLLAFIILAPTGQWLMQRAPVRRERDRLALSLPLVGGLISRFEIGRFSRTFGVLLANGVPTTRALALCGSTVGNSILAEAIESAGTRLKEGEGLADPLAQTGRFPNLSIQLIRIGEETGRLENMLGELADIYDQEVQRILERMLALLIPTITVTMGMFIALIIAAIMTAMISINDLAT